MSESDVGSAVIRQLMGEIKGEMLNEMREQELRFLQKVDEQFGKYAERVEKAIEEAIRVNANHATIEHDVRNLKNDVAALKKFVPLLESLAKLYGTSQ